MGKHEPPDLVDSPPPGCCEGVRPGWVNGKVACDATRIFCHSVTCLGIDQCCWDRNHMPGCFIDVLQYVLVIRFQTSPSHIHLQPARGCALRMESKKLFDPREGQLIASTFKQVGILLIASTYRFYLLLKGQLNCECQTSQASSLKGHLVS